MNFIKVLTKNFSRFKDEKMNRKHKSIVGGAIFIGLIIAYAQIYENLGGWYGVLIVLIVITSLISFIAYKYPASRSHIKKAIIFIGSTLGALFSDLGALFAEEKRKAKAERKAIPTHLRNQAKERAKNRCQFFDNNKNQRCGHTQILHVHHIDHDPSNSKTLGNLICLCPNHHYEIHKENKEFPVEEEHRKKIIAFSEGSYNRK